jgi:hypothetical protein
MKIPAQYYAVIAGLALLLSRGTECGAGHPGQLFHRGPGCACGQSPQMHFAPGPAQYSPTSLAGYGCACSAAVPSCCGLGGGLSQLGNLYGSGSGYGAVYEPWHDGGAWESAGAYGFSAGGYTGFEGLPNMDGGGINYRFPYHSYRRPWAHPGPPVTNVSIVW